MAWLEAAVILDWDGASSLEDGAVPTFTFSRTGGAGGRSVVFVTLGQLDQILNRILALAALTALLTEIGLEIFPCSLPSPLLLRGRGSLGPGHGLRLNLVFTGAVASVGIAVPHHRAALGCSQI